jgi:hypothetical protein
MWATREGEGCSGAAAGVAPNRKRTAEGRRDGLAGCEKLGVQTAWKKRSSSFLAPTCFFLLGPPPWQSLPVPASPPNQGPGILRYAGTRTGAAWGDGAPLKPPTPPMPTNPVFSHRPFEMRATITRWSGRLRFTMLRVPFHHVRATTESPTR